VYFTAWFCEGHSSAFFVVSEIKKKKEHKGIWGIAERN